MSDYTNITHTFEPIYNKNSKILILGTMPSVKSREVNFYYGHPQNRFWKVISNITNSELPKTKKEKIKLLLDNNIAIWDVLKSCDIIGSDDNSIKNPIPNDFTDILSSTNITRIFTNGKKADALYKKYCLNITNIESVCLPSTSPANAVWNTDKLCLFWKENLIL